MKVNEKWFVSWDAYYKGSDQLILSKCGSEIYAAPQGTNVEDVHESVLENLKNRDSRYIIIMRSLNRV